MKPLQIESQAHQVPLTVDCAAKDEYYFGLKGHVLIDLRGAITAMTVTSANCDERDAAYDMLNLIEERWSLFALHR